MKVRFIVYAILLVVTIGTSYAADNTPADDGLRLQLSKSLTLDPDGQPPQAPADPARSMQWPMMLAFALMTLALLTMWARSRRRDDDAVQAAAQADHVVALRTALMDTGSEPRQEWESSLTTFKSEIATKNRRIDELIDERTGLAGQLAELELRLHEIQEDSDAALSRHSEAMHEIQTQLDAMERAHAEACSELDAVHVQLASALELNESHLTRSADAEASLATLTAEKAEVHAQLQQRDEELQATTGENQQQLATIATLEGDLSTLTQTHSETVNALAEITGRSEELQEESSAELAAAKLLVEQHEAAIARLEEQLKTSETARDEATSALEQGTHEQEALQLEFNALTAQHNELCTSFENREVELQTTREELQTLGEARQQNDAHTASNSQLQEDNGSLQNRVETLQSELEQLTATLNEKSELLSANDGRVAELEAENSRLAEQIDLVQEQESTSSSTITNLEDSLSDSERAQLQNKQELDEIASQTREDLQKRAVKLEAIAAERDELLGKLERLQTRLSTAEEDMHRKDMKALTVSAELVELKSRHEDYLQEIAGLEARLDDPGENKRRLLVDAESQELRDSIRARDHIVSALEEDLQNAEKANETLRQDLEQLQLAAAAHSHDVRATTEPGAGSTEEETALLKQQLVEKIRQLTLLESELKVSKDLIGVFEQDSKKLMHVEAELTETKDSNEFLQNELASSVNQVNNLKKALHNSATDAQRQQELGRMPSKPIPHQELLFRLATLEAQNREQVEMIEALKTVRENSADSQT